MPPRKPIKPSGPSPWLIFGASLLAGPIISVGSGYIASEITAARTEERLSVLSTRVGDIDTRSLARFDRIEAGLRSSDLAAASNTTRLDGLMRELENADRRDVERTASLVAAIARLQARLDASRNMGGEGIDEPWLTPRRAILRRDATSENDFE